jgi:hypothetical protein
MNEIKKCPKKKCGGEMVYVEAQGRAPAEHICKDCGYVVLDYHCAVCGCALGFKKRTEVHEHYLDELAALFQKKGHKIITEGGIPEYRGKEWGKPDIFVLKELVVQKIVEVSVCDLKEGTAPNTMESKCRKIKEYYNPPEIIVFEPTRYTTEYYPASLGKFANYDEYNAHLHKKWINEGLIVTFWNELNLKEQKKGVEP